MLFSLLVVRRLRNSNGVLKCLLENSLIGKCQLFHTLLPEAFLEILPHEREIEQRSGEEREKNQGNYFTLH